MTEPMVKLSDVVKMMREKRMVKLSDIVKVMRKDAEIMRHSFEGKEAWELCAEYLEETASIYEKEINWEEM